MKDRWFKWTILIFLTILLGCVIAGIIFGDNTKEITIHAPKDEKIEIVVVGGTTVTIDEEVNND